MARLSETPARSLLPAPLQGYELVPKSDAASMLDAAGALAIALARTRATLRRDSGSEALLMALEPLMSAAEEMAIAVSMAIPNQRPRRALHPQP